MKIANPQIEYCEKITAFTANAWSILLKFEKVKILSIKLPIITRCNVYPIDPDLVLCVDSTECGGPALLCRTHALVRYTLTIGVVLYYIHIHII